MSDLRPPSVPARIDRAAVDRVLARALELQAASGGGETEGQLTEAQLVALAKEVGLDPVNLRQALAEERTRSIAPVETGVLASLFGAAVPSAQRTVRGTPVPVLKALDEWMQKQEGLCVQRMFADRIVWEPARGIMTAVRRAVSGRGHVLGRASTVSATVVPVDDGRVIVRLDANLAEHRTMMAQQSVAIGGGGVVASGVLAVLSFTIPVAVVPAVLFAPAAYAMSRSAHRRLAERTQLALEQVLDRLERNETGRMPTLAGMLAAAVSGR